MDISSYRYRSTFTSVAKVIVPTEEDRFIAKASLKNLGGILPPGINPDENPDMLYIAFDGAVAGLVNKNGDGITASTALAINKTARYKFISTEHDRKQIVGVILHPAFSCFGDNQPLTDEQAAQMAQPFNMAYVGALWKTVSPMLAKYIHRTDDAADEDVLSTSWEIAFDTYSIGVGSKNLWDAQIIPKTDASFASYDKMLRANGGSGKDEGGRPVFRVLDGDALILGYSIVPNPAAEVKGILPLEVPLNPVTPPKDPTAKSSELYEIETVAPISLPDGEYKANRFGYSVKINEEIFATKTGVRCAEDEAIRMEVVIKGGKLYQIVYEAKPNTLSAQFSAYLEEQPKSGVGYHLCDIIMKDGKIHSQIPIVNNSVLPMEINTNDISSIEICKKSEKSEEISQASRVNTITLPNFSMKIENLTDLKTKWDEIRKLESSASVEEYLQTEIQKFAEKEAAKAKAEQDRVKSIEEAKASAEKALAAQADSAKQLETSIQALQTQIAELKEAAATKEAAAKFNDRMRLFDEKFDLDQDDQKFIAADVNAIPADNDAAFDSYFKKQEKLLAAKMKKDKKDKKEKEPDGDEMKAAFASITSVPAASIIYTASPLVSETEKTKTAAAFNDAFLFNGKTAASLSASK